MHSLIAAIGWLVLFSSPALAVCPATFTGCPSLSVNDVAANILSGSMSTTATGNKTARARADRVADVVNVKNFGAMGDAKAYSTAAGYSSANGTIAAGAKTLKATEHTTFSPVDIGKAITVNGAGPSGVPLVTTIASYVGPQTVELANAAASATPRWKMGNCNVTKDQSGAGSYAPGDTVTLAGGIGAAGVCTVYATLVHSATINTPGSGGADGSCVLTGTTGAIASGQGRFRINATISEGVVTALGNFVNQSIYTTNPTLLTAEPVTGCGLSDATLALRMGVKYAWISRKGLYSVTPIEPIAQDSTSGSGTGVTFTNVTDSTGTFYYGTDDGQAFHNAIDAVNRKLASGVPAILYIPSGYYMIRDTSFPMFVHGGSVVGTGPLKSVLLIDTPYSGDIFSWDEAWLGSSPFNAPTPSLSTDLASPLVSGFSIIGNRESANTQNAFMFYDRTSGLLMQDIGISDLNGRAIYAGVTKSQPSAWMTEATFRNINIARVGAANMATVEFNAIQGVTSDLHFENFNIYAPQAIAGLWVHAAAASTATLLWFTNLRIEGFEYQPNDNTGDLLRLGDATGSGNTNGIMINTSSLVDPYLGGAALHVMQPRGPTGSTYGIIFEGNITGGLPYGRGLWLEGGRNSHYFVGDWNTYDYNVVVGSSSFVGAGNTISGTNPVNIGVTTSIDPTSIQHVQYPIESTFGGMIRLNPITVGSLPACSANAVGQLAEVSDARGPTYGATIAGGGGEIALAICDGTNWKVR